MLKRTENHRALAELVFLPVHTRAEGSSLISRVFLCPKWVMGWVICTLCPCPLGGFSPHHVQQFLPGSFCCFQFFGCFGVEISHGLSINIVCGH